MTNKRVWDLMSWVGAWNLPPCEALKYQGQPVHNIEELFKAFHASYNSAERREVDLSALEPLDNCSVHPWSPISTPELLDALKTCLSQSAPGPNHITWSHLKYVASSPVCAQLFTTLAEACVTLGEWPKYFKGSRSVIIPKAGKAKYTTPKSFCPIALLNTLGKLIEKVITNHLQFDTVRNAVMHPNQLRGIIQRSMEDAGLFLTYVMRAGWAKGLVTSMVAFDIAQFFPSISHLVLLEVIRKMGFAEELVGFFRSYLVGRRTKFMWGSEESEWFPSSVGVGQGLALSPILSVLMVVPILTMFNNQAQAKGIDIMALLYVDDGLLVAQGKTWEENLEMLRHAYVVVFELMTALGLELEHSKMEVFHFSR